MDEEAQHMSNEINGISDKIESLQPLNINNGNHVESTGRVATEHEEQIGTNIVFSVTVVDSSYMYGDTKLKQYDDETNLKQQF